MPDYDDIYRRHADEYERLVSREDYQHNIALALNDVRPLDRLKVIECGAGTGRLTTLLAPVVRSIHAFDASPAMLRVALGKLRQLEKRNWFVSVADHRHLPVRACSADLVISGWSISHLVVTSGEAWRRELDQALAEMHRVLRPGGTIIILETLGTGCETPEPPDTLRPYYKYLDEGGFSSFWIRTDYQFKSLEEAEKLTRFFFDELADKVVKKHWVTLPECTGIWWQKL